MLASMFDDIIYSSWFNLCIMIAVEYVVSGSAGVTQNDNK